MIYSFLFGAIVGGIGLWLLISNGPMDSSKVSEDWLKQHGYDRRGY